MQIVAWMECLRVGGDAEVQVYIYPVECAFCSFLDPTHVYSLMWIAVSFSRSVPLHRFLLFSRFRLGNEFYWCDRSCAARLKLLKFYLPPFLSLYRHPFLHPSITLVFLVHPSSVFSFGPFGLQQGCVFVCVVYVSCGFNYNSSPLT